jgi:hypothetical protein
VLPVRPARCGHACSRTAAGVLVHLTNTSHSCALHATQHRRRPLSYTLASTHRGKRDRPIRALSSWFFPWWHDNHGTVSSDNDATPRSCWEDKLLIGEQMRDSQPAGPDDRLPESAQQKAKPTTVVQVTEWVVLVPSVVRCPAQPDSIVSTSATAPRARPQAVAGRLGGSRPQRGVSGGASPLHASHMGAPFLRSARLFRPGPGGTTMTPEEWFCCVFLFESRNLQALLLLDALISLLIKNQTPCVRDA